MDTTIRGQAMLGVEASRVWMYLGKHETVIRESAKVLPGVPISKLPPRFLAIMSISHLHLGQIQDSEEYLEELFDRAEISAGGSPSFYIAMIYCQKGEINQAFKWLEKSYQDREVEMYWLKVEPPFEPIRSDPRYQELLDKVGFPKG